MKIFLFFILINLISFIQCHAFFNRDLHIITMQDGLADNKVNCIYKDKDGFMWFGTDNGLSRYDGSCIKNFTTHDNSYMRISGVNKLSEHCLGMLVQGKLYAINRLTETFIPVKLESQEIKLKQFIMNEHNICCIINANSLLLCEVIEKKNSKGEITHLSLRMKEKIEKVAGEENEIDCARFSADGEKIYLVNNDSDLISYDLKRKKITKEASLNTTVPLSYSTILDNDNRLWLPTIGDGIMLYDKVTKKVEHISYSNNADNLLSHTDVYDIIPINNGKLLAVTWNGYTILTPDKEIPQNLKTNIYNNVSLVNRNLETRMICCYYDRQGILWVGTNGGGVMYSDLRSQYFNQFHQDRHNEICGITADNNGYIWLATYHKGIMKSTTPFDPFGSIDFKTLFNDKKIVLCTLKDNKGNLWFGNSDGTLTSYNDATGFKTVSIYNDSIINKSAIWAMCIDTHNRFWIGTDSGLYLLNPLSEDCKRISFKNDSSFEKNLPIRAITETKDGKIWIGTLHNGVNKVVDNEIFPIVYSTMPNLQHSSVRSLLASSDGFLYIGYEDGFAIMDPQNEEVKSYYTTHDGLCNNFIGCIVEDVSGQIWLGSNSGISRYSRHQKLFYHYYISGSNRSAFLYNKNLFWGNNKSLTYFNPENINSFPSTKKIAITELEVGNKSVKIGEEINNQVILRNSLFFTKRIELNTSNRDFTLSFNNFSYSKEQQKYKYRLYPYQKEWIVTNKNEKVSYANLPAGEYTFEVQNLYPDEKIGELTSLKVAILPHWSETLLFRLSVLSLFISILLWSINRVRIKQKRLKHELELEREVFTAKIERDKERQIRLERENFFTNAAHELRTPLTLILSPLQDLLHKLKPSDAFYEPLQLMYHNGSSLHILVDHLLYVQKIEAGMVKLCLTEVDITELIKEVAQAFRHLAETEKIDFNVQLSSTPIMLWIDIEKIISAVRNLLSNAFKYTSKEGKVDLRVDRIEIDDKWFCRIIVSDSGKGIPEHLQERVFDSFITGESTPSFSTKIGIGLRIVKNTMDLHHGSVTLESRSGEGTLFTLHIPEGNAHFTEDKYEVITESVSELESYLEPSTLEQNKKDIQRKSLLIIEDNIEVRKYVCSLFRRDYIIWEAENGDEGIRVATEKLPDLIISDIMMPITDGFIASRTIREQPSTAHIPILMLTAKNEDIDILQASHIGIDDYMMKPFNPEILRSKVKNLIAQRERLKRIYTRTLMLKQQVMNKTEGDGSTDGFIKQVVQVIAANISNENFNVKMLADQLNMSQPTLYRKLKQHTELAAIEMIRSVRMSKAATLIVENRYSMQEIAEMVGYNDIRTLRKHFTELFGVSPSKYINDKVQ